MNSEDLNHPPTAVGGIMSPELKRSCRKDLQESAHGRARFVDSDLLTLILVLH